MVAFAFQRAEHVTLNMPSVASGEGGAGFHPSSLSPFLLTLTSPLPIFFFLASVREQQPCSVKFARALSQPQTYHVDGGIPFVGSEVHLALID